MSDRTESSFEDTSQWATVDTTTLIIPTVIGVLAMALTAEAIAAFIGPAYTYGGDVCADTATIAESCGVAPAGLIPAIAVGVFAGHAAFVAQRRALRRWSG